MTRPHVTSVRTVLVALAALALFMGCSTTPKDPYFMKTVTHANVYVSPERSPIFKVAIMPFRAQTELIGSSVSDMFVTEMLRARRYELVERGQMSRVLSESELSLAGLSDSRAVEIGAMLGADGVVIGTVDEYSTTAERGKTYPVVGMSVRLIDVGSGKVMWSCDHARRSDSHKTTVPEHARTIVHELTSALYKNWHVQKMVARPKTRSRSRSKPIDEPVAMKTVSAPPMPPDFSLGDMGMREVEISWKGIPSNASKFRIQRSKAMDGPFEEVDTVTASKMSYTDHGSRSSPLDDMTTYYYRMISITSDGVESAPSAVRESMTAPPPDPPTGLSAEAHTSRGVRIFWDPASSEGIERYIVERAKGATGEDFVRIGTAESLNFVDGGSATSTLEDDSFYRYRVASVNRVGAEGPFSKPVSVTTLPPPAAVKGVRARSDEVRCVPVTWQASEEPDIFGYNIYKKGPGDSEFSLLTMAKGVNNTSFLDGGRDPGSLEDNTTYEYRVTAFNSVGSEGEQSLTAKATTRTPPPAVASLRAESDLPREVKLEWRASFDDKVNGYVIYRAGPGESEFSEIARGSGIDTTTYTDQGKTGWLSGDLGALLDDTEYRYRVLAYNTALALSPDGDTVRATTKKLPEPPRGLEATEDLPHSIQISWRSNYETDIESYLVEACSTANGRFREIARVDATGTTYVEKNLDNAEPRFYRVKAIDEDTLESDWSEIIGGQTKPLPDSPRDVVAQWSGDEVTVSWSRPEQFDIVGYNVWKKGFIGAELIENVSFRECSLGAEVVGKKIVVQVSSVDEDGLESERSEPVEIRPPE